MSRASHRLLEMTGQCRKCLDLFSIEMQPSKKVVGDTHYFQPILTAHLGYENHQLIHRPGHCGGTIRLFASPRLATFQ